MKLYLTTLFLILSFVNFAQSPYRAPLNPYFVNQTEKKGYIHPPHKVTHQSILTKSSDILPSNFDLRDVEGQSFIPPVKNQNPFGTCWSFATLASVESNWKMMGDENFTSLSVKNMVTCHGYVFTHDEGGNEYTSTAYLSRLAGPVYESSDPYENLYNDTLCAPVNKTTDIPAYIDNILWLGNNQEMTKRTLMEHGALSTSMKADFSSHYYNSDDYTYYYNGTESVDHGVAIVGWDDHKVVTGGTDATPTSPGAWIIRNSWGSSAQDQGYFYASYEDVHIGRSSELYYGKTLVSDVDVIFDYAKLGAITSYSSGSSSDVAYAAVKYTADQDYFITHIGSALLSEGTTIDLTLCKSFDGQNFTDTIAHRSDIFCTYAGYKKIDFPALVSQGDFYLITKYYTPNDFYPLPAETVVEEYCYPAVEENVMWVSSDAYSWTKAGANTDYDFDLAVKIIAKKPDVVQPYFLAENSIACIDQEISFENKTMGEADSFYWYFSDETIVTYDKNQNISKSFSSAGSQQLTLVAYKDGSVYEFTSSAVEVVSSIYPQITVVNAKDYFSRGKPVTLIGNGGTNYRWYADGYLDGDEGHIITFSPEADELWVTMETSLGNCTATDSVLIRTVEVPYDDIADALLLTVNETANDIGNSYASVELNEPLPEIGSCESQNTWCEEGGLQNSIWFKFVAPTSGKVVIDTHGFDNQIALYDAITTGEWQDIMSGNPAKYNILAANDDYHASDYAAKITEVSNLSSGKTYWVQMDGSGGGSTGYTSIIISDPDATQLTETTVKQFLVSQNPTEMHIQCAELKNITLSIYSSSGVLVLQKEIQDEYTLNHLIPGIYFVSLKSEKTHHVTKAVVGNQWQLKIQQQ